MNIPNAISFFRLLLVPVFAFVFFSDMQNSHLVALFIFLFAGATDVLDGYIARKYNLVTKLGRIIDPLADKLMVFTALICLGVAGNISCIFPAFFAVKETSQILCAAKLMNKISDVPPANIWGKFSTCLFYLAITVAILFRNQSQWYAVPLLCASIVLSVSAAVSYYFRAKRLIRNQQHESYKGR